LVGYSHEIGRRVVAEDKTHPGVGVPTIQVFGLREIRVAAQQHLAEAAPETNLQAAVDFGSSAFVGGPIARTIDNAQYLASIGQSQHQRMVAPGAVVGDVHALLALTGGFHQGTVHVDDSLSEEGSRLLSPSLQARLVDDVLQEVNVPD